MRQGLGFEGLAAVTVVGLAAVSLALILLVRPAPLRVVEAAPADGAVAVPLATQVAVTFNRPLDSASASSAIRLMPAVEGLVSVAGRRLAFTPRASLRSDTVYTVTLAPSLRDRGGQPLPAEVHWRFRTAPLTLVMRTTAGALVRGGLAGAREVVARPTVSLFAVSPDGTLAVVRPDARVLVLERPGDPARPLPLSPEQEVQALEWSPNGRVLVLLAGPPGELGVPWIVRIDAAQPRLEPFGPRPAPLEPGTALLTEVLKKSLLEIVYRRETFTFAPGGLGVIVRDENWDFAVVGVDGTRQSSLGPLLEVGSASPAGDAVVVTDVDVSDPALPRQVIVISAGARRRPLSAPGQDSHAPRFAHHRARVVFATAPARGRPAERAFALDVVDVDTGARRRLTTPPPGWSDAAPRWSPDDAWVSFRRHPVGAPEGGRAWIVPADGGAPRALGDDVTDARWRP